MTQPIHFNTKKVRLKQPLKSTDADYAPLFQYQKGAIKTVAREA